MKNLFTLFLCLLCLLPLSGQDQHFTQFYASPLTLNPALTGAINGKYRVGMIYRDQWRNVLEQPFTTYSAAVDVRFDLELNSRFKDAFAAGLMFFTDQVGVLDFNTNAIALSAAFHKGLDWDNRQFLSFGIQAALMQRNVNYESLTFDDQFDGTNGYIFPTAEDLPQNNFAFADLNIGLNYIFQPNNRTALIVGGAIFHSTQPRIAFSEEPQDEEIDEGEGVNLFRKYAGQISAELPLGKGKAVSIIPRLLFSAQGPHLRFNAGTNFRFRMGESGDAAIHIGGWARPVRDQDEEFQMDAVVGLLGVEYRNLLVGFSYDVNLQDTDAGNRRSALEFSVTFLGSFENEEILCPKF